MKKIKANTNTPFTLAMDLNKVKTGRYSPNRGEFSGYVIDSTGTITKFFEGNLRSRAKSEELLAAVKAASQGSGAKEGSDTKQGSAKKGSDTKKGSATKGSGAKESVAKPEGSGAKKGSATKKGSGSK